MQTRTVNFAERGLLLKRVYNYYWPAIILTIFLISLFPGCGKKGPPVPPKRYRLPPVSDLTHRIEDKDLILSWTVPQASGSGKSVTDGCVVFRARQSVMETECTGCPVPFVSIAEIPVTQKSAAASQQFGLTYTETLIPGFAYTYKVVCYTRDGGPGEDSNIVNFSF